MLSDRKIVGAELDFPIVKLEDSMFSHVPNEALLEYHGKKVIHFIGHSLQCEIDGVVVDLKNQPVLWQWCLVVGVREAGLRVLSGWTGSLIIEDLTEDEFRLNCEIVNKETRKKSAKAIGKIALTSMADVIQFEKKHGEVSRSMFQSRAGKRLFEKVEKIKDEYEAKEKKKLEERSRLAEAMDVDTPSGVKDEITDIVIDEAGEPGEWEEAKAEHGSEKEAGQLCSEMPPLEKDGVEVIELE